MSSHPKLRSDKTCLNCGNTVEARFCDKCGQENVDSRQTFGHLIQHFFEDITHYEGKFWKTMKYLLFKPAFLTKEYLKGKRMSYVPPVRLYIFISFITFLLPHILPNYTAESTANEVREEKVISELPRSNQFTFGAGKNGFEIIIPTEFKSKLEIDSVAKANPKIGSLEIWLGERFVKMQKYTPSELGVKFIDSFIGSLPKAIFVYMPLFALVLALFHRKKNWFYFDHAIFTIHYFSFLLLSFSVFNVILSIQYLLHSNYLDFIYFGIAVAYILYMPVYFFLAHKNMYQEKWSKSNLKSLGIYIINLSLFIIVFSGLAFWSVMRIH